MRSNARVLDASKDAAGARAMRERALSAALSSGANSIALRIACDMVDYDGKINDAQHVADTLAQMSSADMGWDMQRARTILQSGRRA